MSPELQICKNCGTENPADVLFCLICGKDLAREPLSDIPELGDILAESSEPLEKNDDLPEFIRNLHDEIPRTSIRRSSIFNESSETEDAQPESNPQESETFEENIPEWLKKIRDRAHTEDDAAGDLIKKVTARETHDLKSPQDDPSEEFEGWLGQVRKSAQRDTVNFQQEGQDDQPDEDEIPAWLLKVRENEGKLMQEAPSEEQQGSSDPGSVPGWVREAAGKEDEIILSTEPTQIIKVKPPTEADQPNSSEDINQIEEQLEEDLSSDNTSSQLNDVTQQLQITSSGEAGIPESKEKEENVKVFWEEIAKNPVSAVIKEQHSKAELFKALLSVEGQPIEKIQKPEKKSSRVIRIILAFLLLIVVSLPFFFGISNDNFIGSLPLPAQAFLDRVEQLGSGSKVLLVVDYSVGVSAEMEHVAAPIITHLAETQVELAVLSSYPEGAWLGERLITSALAYRPDENLQMIVKYLGYLPGGRIGLYNLAQSSQSPIFNGFINLEAVTEPADLGEYDQVIILVDSLQAARNWIELVATRIPEIPVNMISSSQEAAMLLPYFDSGQINGLVAGLYESSLYQASISDTSQTGSTWLSYQIGLLFMIGLMLLGIVIRLESSGDRILKEIKK